MSSRAASFQPQTEELGRPNRGAVERVGVDIEAAAGSGVVRRVLRRTRRTLLWRRPDGSAHPHSRDEFGASGGDGISDDKGRMHAVAWGLSVRPPRHQLDWTLKVTSAGEGP
jgi:hypothetical protein